MIIDKRYKIICRLGKGSMGEVFKVSDQKEDKVIALKLVKTERRINSKKTNPLVDLLKNEFSLLSTFSHENLISVYECGFWKGRFYFTMEYLPGKDIVKFSKGKSLKALYPIFLQIFQGLDYIHTAGLIHGDIKPSNILITRGGAKLLDFSLSRHAFTDLNQIQGTLGYIAPELILQKESDLRADLYAVGVVLYEILSGIMPYKAKRLSGLLKKQLEKSVIPPRKLNNTIPVRLQKVILRLLEPDPWDRYTDIKEVMNSLFPRRTFLLRKKTLPFIGYEKILGKLTAFTEKRRDKGIRAPGVFIISGETGAGKTSLLKEFAKHISIKGIKVFREEMVPGQLPLSSILKQLIAWAPTHIIKVYKSDIVNFYPELSKDIRVRINKRVLEKDAAPSNFRKIIYFINEVLSETQNFSLILLDDLHNSLPEGINFLTRFIQNLSENTGLVISINQDYSVPGFFENVDAVRTDIKGLTFDNIKQIILFDFGEIAMINRVAHKILQSTKGNPLLIKEAINLYLEEKVIENIDGEWSVNIDKLDLMHLPQSAGSVFKDRLKKVDKETREFLCILSIIGEQTTLGFLGNFYNLDNLRKIIRQSVQYNIIKKEKGKILFTHPFLREHFYSSVSEQNKRDWHKKIGQALEKFYASEKIEEILHHYICAQLKTKINKQVSRLLVQPETIVSRSGLLKILLQAMPFAKETPLEFKLTSEIAAIYKRLGNYNKASKYLNQAVAFTKNKMEKVDLLYTLANFTAIKGEFTNALHLFKKGINLLERKRGVMYARFLGRIGEIYLRMGKLDNAFEYLEKALKILRLKKEQKDEALFSSVLGIANFHRGDPGKALNLFKRAIQLGRKLKSNDILSQGYLNLGCLLMNMKKYKEALDYLNKSIKIKEKIGDWENVLGALINIGNIFIAKGEYSKALSHFKRGTVITEKTKNLPLKAGYHFPLGQLYYYMGSYTRALVELQKCLEIQERMGEKVEMTSVFVLLEKIYLEQGDYDNAIEISNKGLKVAKDIGNKLYEIKLLHCLLHIYNAIGAFKKVKGLIKIILKQENIDDFTKAECLKLSADTAIKGSSQEEEQLNEAINIAASTKEDSIDEKREKSFFYLLTSQTYLLKHKLKETRHFYEAGNKRALLIKQNLPDALSLYIKGRLEFESKKYLGAEHAFHYFKRAKTLFDKMEIKEYQWRTNFLFGQCKTQLGEQKEAIYLYEEALKILEDLHSSIKNKSLKQAFWSHPDRKEFFKFIDELR